MIRASASSSSIKALLFENGHFLLEIGLSGRRKKSAQGYMFSGGFSRCFGGTVLRTRTGIIRGAHLTEGDLMLNILTRRGIIVFYRGYFSSVHWEWSLFCPAAVVSVGNCIFD